MKTIVNPDDIKRITNTHKLFANIYTLYGEPPSWSRPEGFVTLAKIILGQQISLESAEAHFKKLNNYIAEFSPVEILKLSDQELRDCQISRQKSRYLRSLATAILEKEIDLTSLDQLDEEEVRRQLIKIKGIGNWTIDIYLMFALQNKDIIPLGDIAIINAIKELSGIKEIKAIHQLSEKWKPLRSLASYFLWHYYLKKRNRNAEI